MDIISMTTISSEVRKFPDGTIQFQRSQMDKFICTVYITAGLVLLALIYVFSSVEGVSTFAMLLFGIGLALFCRGVIALILLPYSIEIHPKEKFIIIKISVLGLIPHKTMINYSIIQGFEIRQYRRRNLSIKEWEFRFVTNSSEQPDSQFLGRTKKANNAQAIAKIMDKESQLKLIS